jgi:hypothetical protein
VTILISSLKHLTLKDNILETVKKVERVNLFQMMERQFETQWRSVREQCLSGCR